MASRALNLRSWAACATYGVLLSVVSVLGGCSVATAAMKSQIDGQCKGAGLKGCPDVADGVILYVDGKDAEGEAKLRSAVAQNSPEQLRKLTELLEPILSAADEDTAKKLQPVLSILKGDGTSPAKPSSTPGEGLEVVVAKSASAATAKSKTVAETPASVVTRPEIDNLRAGMVNPATENQLLPCDTTMADAKTCGRVRVLLGPFVLTNLYTSGGCGRDLFVTSSDSKVYWTMLAPSGDRLNVSGRFPVEEGQTLYIGARGNTPTKDELRCAVVWSGFRPVERPAQARYPME